MAHTRTIKGRKYGNELFGRYFLTLNHNGKVDIHMKMMPFVIRENLIPQIMPKISATIIQQIQRTILTPPKTY